MEPKRLLALKSIILGASLGLAGISESFAQPASWNWTGRVLDEAGKPLAGCAVFLESPPDFRDTTNSNGLFKLVSGTIPVRWNATKPDNRERFEPKMARNAREAGSGLRRTLTGRAMEKGEAH